MPHTLGPDCPGPCADLLCGVLFFFIDSYSLLRFSDIHSISANLGFVVPANQKKADAQTGSLKRCFSEFGVFFL